jgi:hypothetical protein
MSKINSLRILAALLFYIAGSAIGQAQSAKGPGAFGNPQAFCEHDPRPEIIAFCKNLADLQTRVNAEKSLPDANLTHANANFTNALGKLDPTNPKAAADLITAVAAPLATKTAVSNVLRDVGQARPDRQLSPGSQTNGTTSLVSRAGSAELISLAMDAGILTRSINGATTTLTTNADQLFRLITGNDPDCIINCRSLGWFENRVLNFTTITASLDVAQPSSTITATTGQASGTTTPVPVNSAAIPTGAGKLSNLTARYQLMNRFDPHGEKFKQAWREQIPALNPGVILIGDDTKAVLAILNTHAPYSQPDTELQTLVESAEDTLVQAAAKDPSGKALMEAFEKFWNNATSEALQDPKLPAAVSKVMQDRAIYRQAWLNALDQAVGNLLTVEYSFNRPVDQPETNDIKLIYAYNFKSLGMLTLNGATSIYSGALPAGAKYGRLHYGQVSGQYDRTLTSKTSSLQGQLSLAGYWQYQPEPSVLNIPAGTVAPGTTIPLPNGTQEFVGTAGSLWVTQAKITLKGAGGINVPIGVSWSNKTDLLIGSKLGAQFGLSYNFASLANLFTGSHSTQ